MPIAAAVDFGPIIKGQWGIITGYAPSRLAWWQGRYRCTFLGGMKVTASRAQIVPTDHGHSLHALEDPMWFLHRRGMAGWPVRYEPEVLHCLLKA